jgi:hypothetical protein
MLLQALCKEELHELYYARQQTTWSAGAVYTSVVSCMSYAEISRSTELVGGGCGAPVAVQLAMPHKRRFGHFIFSDKDASTRRAGQKASCLLLFSRASASTASILLGQPL